MRYEDEKDHIIRKDSLMVFFSSKRKNTEELVDFQISLYCLNILIKQDLQEFEKDDCTSSYEELISNIKVKQAKFMKALSHELDHNKKLKPITSKTYENFLKTLKAEVTRNQYGSLLKAQFFQCLLPEVKPKPSLDLSPKHRKTLVNEILNTLGGTNVIINDILRLSS